MPLNQSEGSYVCHRCIGEDILSAEIRKIGHRAKCSYCQSKIRCVEISWLAERVVSVYEQIVHVADEVPEPDDDSDKVYWVSRGEYPASILAELLVCDDQTIADDVMEAISDLNVTDPSDVDSGLYQGASDIYEISIPDDSEFHSTWARFCLSLKHHKRFFSDEAESLLNEILGPLLAGDQSWLKNAIRTIKPSDKDRYIYRGRLANERENREKIYSQPIRQLGAPRPSMASAGRMNPAGIAVFYGSLDSTTCVAELRVPVGGTAIVGKFEIIRELRLLDLTRLNEMRTKVSYFHPEFFKLYSYSKFISGFHDEIRKVVLPGNQILEYLPTQVVAEYLWTRKKNSVDGVIFGSSQVGGKHFNIVIFPQAFRIEGDDAEVDCEVQGVHRIVDTEVVYAKTPPKQEPTTHSPDPQKRKFIASDGSEVFIEVTEINPPPPPSLRLLVNEIGCFSVDAIQYKVSQSKVKYEKDIGIFDF